MSQPAPIETPVTKIMVKGYTYETDKAVRVGSKVSLPSPHANKAPWTGIVEATESAYAGPCKQVIEVIEY